MKSKIQTISANKNIAMIAHDNMKQSLCDWSNKHKNTLRPHKLFATGTTAYTLEKQTGLNVTKYISGPLGGDQQIGAKIAEGEIDMLIFFWDPLEAQPHDPDIRALLRIAVVWNIPTACNVGSADFIISSPLMHTDYKPLPPDYSSHKERLTIPKV